MGSGRVRCGVRRLLRLPLGPGLVLRDAGLGSCRCCRVSRAVWRPACEAARPRAGRLSPVSTAVTLVSKMTWAGILHFSSRFTRTPATNADSTASIVANLIVIVGMPSCSGRSLSRWQLEPEAARQQHISYSIYQVLYRPVPGLEPPQGMHCGSSVAHPASSTLDLIDASLAGWPLPIPQSQHDAIPHLLPTLFVSSLACLDFTCAGQLCSASQQDAGRCTIHVHSGPRVRMASPWRRTSMAPCTGGRGCY